MRLLPWKSSPEAAGTSDFDQLRGRLEAEVARPAVIVITSSTAEDGKEIAARGLAQSLATAGYASLLVDTSLASRGQTKPAPGLTLEEIARLVSPDPGTGNPAVLTISDPLLQKTTNQRNIESTLEILRTKFDYVVIAAEHGVSTPFAATVAAAANAVLVTVKTGRRQRAGDVRLSAALARAGSRFLGVLALDRSIIRHDPTLSAAAGRDLISRRIRPVPADKEPQFREIAERRA